MAASGTAQAVMGNHELNAICYHTLHTDTADYLRSHNHSHTEQHQSFLDEYPVGAPAANEVVEWFKALPLNLEIDGLRAIQPAGMMRQSQCLALMTANSKNLTPLRWQTQPRLSSEALRPLSLDK